MTDTTALVQSVIKYKAQREKLKEQNRRKLEDDLTDWKADVGDEIKAMRKTGLSVTDIGNAIGIQNRTFIYEMIAASNKRDGVSVPTKPVVRVDFADKSLSEIIAEAEVIPYTIEWLDDSQTAHVIFSDDEEYYVTFDDGHPTPPDEWADHGKDRRAMYKDILGQIRDRFK